MIKITGNKGQPTTYMCPKLKFIKDLTGKIRDIVTYKIKNTDY